MDLRYAVVLLAGGKGSRMGGRKKSELLYDGETAADRIAAQMKKLQVPCLYSYREEGDHIPEGLIPVKDKSPISLGPVEGITRALEAAKGRGLDGIFTIPCDLPYFRSAAVRKAVDYARRSGQGHTCPESARGTGDAFGRAEGENGSCDCVIYETEDGRRHFTCGYYSAACLPHFLEMLEEGDLRLRGITSRVRTKYLKASDAGLPDFYFTNVNTEEAYEHICRQPARPTVVAVCGFKNSGKTTLLESIVRRMNEAGLKVAVIKHDGHDFQADVPGTDSFRMKAAGAYGTCVFSDSKYSIVKEKSVSVKDLIEQFPEADLVLLEGLKHSEYPKIEIVHQDLCKGGESTDSSFCQIIRLAADPSTVLAYVTDQELQEELQRNRPAGNREEEHQWNRPAGTTNHREIPVFRNTDLDGICRLILRQMDKDRVCGFKGTVRLHL